MGCLSISRIVKDYVDKKGIFRPLWPIYLGKIDLPGWTLPTISQKYPTMESLRDDIIKFLISDDNLEPGEYVYFPMIGALPKKIRVKQGNKIKITGNDIADYLSRNRKEFSSAMLNRSMRASSRRRY
jgi:hypothetical protein